MIYLRQNLIERNNRRNDILTEIEAKEKQIEEYEKYYEEIKQLHQEVSGQENRKEELLKQIANITEILVKNKEEMESLS